jgi:hypothetical protein
MKETTWKNWMSMGQCVTDRETMNERNHLEDLDVDGSVWVGFVWRMTGINGGHS